MSKRPRQNNDSDGLLRFWAFFLTGFYCVVGLIGVLIPMGALRDDSNKLYLIQCAIGGLLFGFACVAVAAYWGLLTGQAWAITPLSIVAWAALIAFPFGTGFGIMVLLELRGGQRPRPRDRTHNVGLRGKKPDKGD